MVVVVFRDFLSIRRLETVMYFTVILVEFYKNKMCNGMKTSKKCHRC